MGLFLLIIIGVGIMLYCYQESMKNDAREAERLKSLKSDFEEQERKYDRALKNILGAEKYILYLMSEAFKSEKEDEEIIQWTIKYINRLEQEIENIEKAVIIMRDRSDKLLQQGYYYDKCKMIPCWEGSKEQEEALRIIARVKEHEERLKTFRSQVYKLAESNMIIPSDYGKIDKEYWDSINSMERGEAIDYINKCKRTIDNKDVDGIYRIDIKEVLKCVWFFASEKIFVLSDYQSAISIFNKIYRRKHLDIMIADLYVKMKVGGEEVLREPIRKILKEEQRVEWLTAISSALMWMKAYKSEYAILQHMVTEEMSMTAKLQERLHSLSNGGEKVPDTYEITNSNKKLYYDIAALTWQDDEYIAFFDNLAFQDKVLNYSLAVREESKELFIAKEVKIPEDDMILYKFKNTFEEEYGLDVTVQKRLVSIAKTGCLGIK